MDPQDHDPAGTAFDAALATDAGGQNGGAVDEDDLVEGYMELLRSGVACVARIDRKRWVLQDSDGDYALPQRYVHLEGSLLETGFETTCSCSRGDSMRLCLHQQVLQRYWAFFGEEVLLGGGQDNPEAVFVDDARPSRAVLSVHQAEDLQSNDGKRAIVRWLGGQEWECRKCPPPHQAPAGACIHRKRAKQCLTVLGVVTDGKGVEELAQPDQEEETGVHQEPLLLANETSSRSHLRIPPPAFAALSQDLASSFAVDLAHLPAPLPLGLNLACACGARGVDGCAVLVQPCRIYLHERAVEWTVETQECRCQRRGSRWTIGPDLGEYGLLSWTNLVIISHSLLNACSSQMLRSPTPLSAFARTVRDKYLETQSPPFLSNTTFNKVYLSFIRLQSVEAPFTCSTCGPAPSTIIADGVSLSFSSSRLARTLEPPTTPSGPVCDDVRPRRLAAFLPNRTLRSSVPLFVAGLRDPDNELGSRWDNTMTALQAYTGSPEDMEVVEATLLLLGQLADPTFTSAFPLTLILLAHLSTNDPILSLIPPALAPLVQPMLENPLVSLSRANDVARLFPAFGALALHYANAKSAIPIVLVGFVAIAAQRACDSYDLLRGNHLVAGGQEAVALPEPPPREWEVTGVYYGPAQVRKRPFYRHFKEKGPVMGEEEGGLVGETKVAGEEAERACKKYYSTYSQKRQTGGIMALWCRHSVCYGFHVIPRGEGRNDVFSALLTRFPTAPKYVIYNFASTFASTYTPYIPTLAKVNTSAAESGNAALGRIRKTISYSSQETAVALTRHFLSLWNRVKLQSKL